MKIASQIIFMFYLFECHCLSLVALVCVGYGSVWACVFVGWSEGVFRCVGVYVGCVGGSWWCGCMVVSTLLFFPLSSLIECKMMFLSYLISGKHMLESCV